VSYRPELYDTVFLHNITEQDAGENATFILASGWNDSPFPAFYERAKARGSKTLTMPCGHDVMLDRPEELTSTLLGIAAAQRRS
jgi:hypothetical protein